MLDVLVDISALLDLVFLFQTRHRRNRQVASSAAAAFEALLIYDNPGLDSVSYNILSNANASSRFLKYYCDENVVAAIEQFFELRAFCRQIDHPLDASQFYERAVILLEECLTTISDTTDLRAYELYDYLPYHLGEDPTAIECQLTDAAVSDLDSLAMRGGNSSIVSRLSRCLADRGHPKRAAWVLPLWRLFYYQALQQDMALHILPHVAKTTLAFGCEAETVAHRRLLDYCTESFRTRYRKRARELFGGDIVTLSIPAFADQLLRKFRTWNELTVTIRQLRNSQAMTDYRRALGLLMLELETASTLNQERVGPAYQQFIDSASQLAIALGTGKAFRTVRIALPFSTPATEVNSKNRFILAHNAFLAIPPGG